MKDAVKHTESTLGPVDILVNAAGCMYYTLMKNAHEDEWEKQVDVNCKVIVKEKTVIWNCNGVWYLIMNSQFVFVLFSVLFLHFLEINSLLLSFVIVIDVIPIILFVHFRPKLLLHACL